jgi:tetratricopeptide (TPR) repeat protein
LLWVAMLAIPASLMAQKPKSQKEVDAINAIAQAKTPDERMAAVDALLQKFADTEFKTWALNAAANAAEQKQDSAKAMFYAGEGLKSDKNDYEAMILLATETARHTREFDLDKDEKLQKSEKYAKDALAVLPSATKPAIMNVTEAQWEMMKKDYMAQAHEALAMGASVRKNTDAAIQEYKMATDLAATPDGATWVRLASVYNDAGKSDEALAAANKVLAMADLNPVVKQFAESEKARAEKAKAAKK